MWISLAASWYKFPTMKEQNSLTSTFLTGLASGLSAPVFAFAPPVAISVPHVASVAQPATKSIGKTLAADGQRVMQDFQDVLTVSG